MTSTSDEVTFYQPTRTPLAEAAGLGYNVFLDGTVAPAYQLRVWGANRTDGAADGFTSLTWEPSRNGGNPGVGEWKNFDALEDGLWWSSRDIAGATGRQAVSLDAIRTANPDAVIRAYGVRVGTGAAASTSFAVNVKFGCDTWDFESLPSLSSGSSGS
ncbi:hypothetical protein ACWF62_06580 [Rhodococcus sp. NPDC054953]